MIGLLRKLRTILSVPFYRRLAMIPASAVLLLVTLAMILRRTDPALIA